MRFECVCIFKQVSEKNAAADMRLIHLSLISAQVHLSTKATYMTHITTKVNRRKRIERNKWVR